MNNHVESTTSLVEYRQQRVAQDVEAARRSDAWKRTRIRAGILLIRLGEKLERGAASMAPATPATPAPAHQAHD